MNNYQSNEAHNKNGGVKSFCIENEYSSDPDENSVEEVSNTNMKNLNRIGSFRLNNTNGSSIYFRKLRL